MTGPLAENPNENTKYVLREFLEEELGLDWDCEFGNVHRFGKRREGKPRPIVARFLYYKDLALIKRSAYTLKGKPYSIRI